MTFTPKPKPISVTIVGKDKEGNAIHIHNEQLFGFITMSGPEIDRICTNLDKQFPGLRWEVTMMKD